MKKNLFNILFIFCVVGVFAGIVFHVKWLDYLCKPLIMISVGGYFLAKSKNLDITVVRFALVAFLFSLFGDSFLMFVERGMIFFMLGLGSFLVAQIFYILLFFRTIKLSGGEPFLRKNLLYLNGYIMYGVIVYALLFNQLDIALKITVFVYMLAIVGMSAMALNRYKTVNKTSFLHVFAGSVLFVISDTLIALDKFFTSIPADRLLIMSTYIAAQYLIMKGILKQFDNEFVK
jgi:uncharacterized membrane protein YhhN